MNTSSFLGFPLVSFAHDGLFLESADADQK
jgi:hypothetical protein